MSAEAPRARPSGAPQRPCQAGGHAPGLGHPSQPQRARPCSEITWGSETEPSHTNNEEEVPGQHSVGRVSLSSVAWEPGAKGGEGAGPGSRHTGGRGAWFPTDRRPTTHLIFRPDAGERRKVTAAAAAQPGLPRTGRVASSPLSPSSHNACASVSSAGSPSFLQILGRALPGSLSR